MWIRSMILISAIGCVGTGDAEPAIATVSADTTVPFQCLNHTTIHVVTCEGSISLFPITVTIGILSDNDLTIRTILSGALDELAIVDRDILNYSEILDDVEGVVVDVLDEFAVPVTDDVVLVCTTLTGPPICV